MQCLNGFKCFKADGFRDLESVLTNSQHAEIFSEKLCLLIYSLYSIAAKNLQQKLNLLTICGL